MEMEKAIWLASIFGPFLLITGLWMLLYNENVMKIRTSIKANPSCFYVIAAANLLIGMTIISQSNIWQWNAAFLVTVLGWVLILRGILSLFVPKIVIQFTLENKELMKFLGIIPLIWGISLCWFAFS